jgi:hypothetical protein
LVFFAKNGLEKHKKALFSAGMLPKTGLFVLLFRENQDSDAFFSLIRFHSSSRNRWKRLKRALIS